MKRRSLLYYFFILSLFCFTFSSCNIPSSNLEDRIAIGVAQTSVVQTQLALDKKDAEAGSINEVEAPLPPNPEAPPLSPVEPSPTNTLTLIPTETITPTITLTVTLSVPMVSVSKNTNCRKGPGQVYKIVGALLENEQAEVVGRSADGQNWIIKNPDGAGECWLWAYYASVSGPTDNLPVYTPPPQFDWSGNWTTYAGGPAFLFDYPMTVTVKDKNFTAIVDYGGGITASLIGTISDDYLTVSGTWTEAIGKGTFSFYALGMNQFQGNCNDGVGAGPWCGDRTGSKPPNPCQKP